MLVLDKGGHTIGNCGLKSVQYTEYLDDPRNAKCFNDDSLSKRHYLTTLIKHCCMSTKYKCSFKMFDIYRNIRLLCCFVLQSKLLFRNEQ